MKVSNQIRQERLQQQQLLQLLLLLLVVSTVICMSGLEILHLWQKIQDIFQY